MKKSDNSSAPEKDGTILQESQDEKPNYNEELFVTVTSQNKVTVIPEFCTSLFKYNLSEVGTEIESELYEYEAELELLLNKFPTPFTIVQEFYHIDYK